MLGAAGWTVRAQQQEQLCPPYRSAEVHGIRALVQAADAGKDGSQLHVRLAVDDDAPRAALSVVEQQDDRAPEVGIPEVLTGYQKPAGGQRCLARVLAHRGGRRQHKRQESEAGGRCPSPETSFAFASGSPVGHWEAPISCQVQGLRRANVTDFTASFNPSRALTTAPDIGYNLLENHRLNASCRRALRLGRNADDGHA